jgi:hypothetical protein
MHCWTYNKFNAEHGRTKHPQNNSSRRAEIAADVASKPGRETGELIQQRA